MTLYVDICHFYIPQTKKNQKHKAENSWEPIFCLSINLVLLSCIISFTAIRSSPLKLDRTASM